jgi:transaldolase / glucose-6-phosphate isomerase
MSAEEPDSAVEQACSVLRERHAVDRLYDRDASLWSDDPEHQAVVANRLGWLDAPSATGEFLARLDEVRAAVGGYRRVVLAGMGGSSLAPEVFSKVFRGHGATVPLDLLDSTHPDAVRAVLDDTDLTGTVVIVASKSGTTEETACFASHAAALVPPERLVAITDPGSQLEQQARDAGWAAVVTNPADIGGRYSALSFFGAVPASLVGVPVAKTWQAAATMLEACRRSVGENPAAQLAAFMAGNALAGRDKLTLLAPSALAPLGDWIEQLVAESTGKLGKGIVPVVGEPVDEPGVYGDDRAFVELRLRADAVLGVDELRDAGHPVFTIDVPGEPHLGAEFLLWEIATALAGVVLGVNPFDEPNVSESKANTVAVLDEVTGGTPLPRPEHGDVRALLGGLRPGDYVSIQAYLPPTAQHADELLRMRQFIRDRRRVATTVGWGPRFLHSTGQLHKGGADNVVALQIVDAPTAGPDIPDRPYDFATLVRAQALGDLRSLRDKGRRVAQVSVEEGGLEQIVALVEAATR